MSQQPMSEFDAAKSITEMLRSMDTAQQERAIRWAMETLGLAGSPARHPAVVPPVQPSAAGALLVPPAGSTAAVAPDIRSFVRSKNPKSDMQTATAVAYYYRFIAPANERKETINGEDLADAIRKIGREQPKHPSKTLHNAKANGYLDAAGDGQFRINSVGENLVTMTLGQNGPAEDVSTSQKRRKKKAKLPRKKSAKANKQGE